MTSSSGGAVHYARLDSKSQGHSWVAYYSQLAFSVKFIVTVFLLVILISFVVLIWGRAKAPGSQLERLAQERHAGMNLGNVASNDEVQSTKKPRILRTLPPDVKLAVSRCPHPHEPSPALLDSIRLLDDNPTCQKVLFAAACQLEKGLLYDATLPVTCPKGKPSLKLIL